MTAKDSQTINEKSKIDVFRILDEYPIKDLHLVITDKLAECYGSLVSFILGDAEKHSGPNIFDVELPSLTQNLLNRDKATQQKVLLIRKMAKHKLNSSYSQQFIKLLHWLTKFDSEYRCLPQTALNMDCFKQNKLLKSNLSLEDLLNVAADSIEKEQKLTGLTESNYYLEKLLDSLGMCYEESCQRLYTLENGGGSPPEVTSHPYSITARRGANLRYTMESDTIQELAVELGCPKTTLWAGLKKLLAG